MKTNQQSSWNNIATFAKAQNQSAWLGGIDLVISCKDLA